MRSAVGEPRHRGRARTIPQLADNGRVNDLASLAPLLTDDGQALLAAPDTATRLREELRLLHREIALVARVTSVPAGLADLAVRPGPN